MSYLEDSVFRDIERIRAPGAIAQHLADAWKDWTGEAPENVAVEVDNTSYEPFAGAAVVAEVSVVSHADARTVGAPSPANEELHETLLEIRATLARIEDRLTALETRETRPTERIPLRSGEDEPNLSKIVADIAALKQSLDGGVPKADKSKPVSSTAGE